MTTALAQGTQQFRAFADPTRLRILHLLGARELCVCHLVETLDVSQPKVSRHLAILRRAGLVAVRVEGPWRHYSLPAERSGLAATLLGCVGTCLGDIAELRADLARLAAIGARPACGTPEPTP